LLLFFLGCFLLYLSVLLLFFFFCGVFTHAMHSKRKKKSYPIITISFHFHSSKGAKTFSGSWSTMRRRMVGTKKLRKEKNCTGKIANGTYLSHHTIIIACLAFPC